MTLPDGKFGKKFIDCGYCRKTLPKKYCRRHSLKSSITYVKFVAEPEVIKRIAAVLDRISGKTNDFYTMKAIADERKRLKGES